MNNLLSNLLIIASVIFIVVMLGSLLLISSEDNYHYAYINLNNELGVSVRCRHDQCEDLNGNVIYVKDYIDIREKK